MYSGLSVIPPGVRYSMSVLVVLSYLIKRFKHLELSYYLAGRHSTKLLRCWWNVVIRESKISLPYAGFLPPTVKYPQRMSILMVLDLWMPNHERQFQTSWGMKESIHAKWTAGSLVHESPHFQVPCWYAISPSQSKPQPTAPSKPPDPSSPTSHQQLEKQRQDTTYDASSRRCGSPAINRKQTPIFKKLWYDNGSLPKMETW